MKYKLLFLLKYPMTALLLILLSVCLSFCLTSSLGHAERTQDNICCFADTIKSAADILNNEFTCPPTTANTTSATTTTTTVTTTSKYEVCEPERLAGQSPNSKFYQERLAIAGDSITLGLCYYGFIPNMHNIAADSVSMWNLDYFTFDLGGGEMGMVDAIDYVHPRLLYMSVGMNDVNLNYPDPYVERYREVIEELIKRMPDINIVVAAITPVSSYCNVVRNDIIREYNAALKDMVMDMDLPQVVFFDTYSVVCDNEQNLKDDYSSGDGMHLYIPCYNNILTALFDFLDTTDFKQRLGG
ncbi:SGNH/GDSL hydrolase family protein [Ruminococcus flavefaciens]|uniref:SGNH/GDSL hydrolase family protein n=1 Tax=Ruminococcus flavefaciens TaxID=1265 RepID=UPI00048F38D2|nr:SGNH/GDSL hydrolase family protein [Ruminococcus flavefaciens]